jgi:hypothetical protein
VVFARLFHRAPITIADVPALVDQVLPEGRSVRAERVMTE